MTILSLGEVGNDITVPEQAWRRSTMTFRPQNRLGEGQNGITVLERVFCYLS